MSKNSQNEGQNKVREKKSMTRARAEYLLSHGADPNDFTKHKNYHVKRKAWKLMGCPLPENTDEQNKFLSTLQGMEIPKNSNAQVGFYQLVRQRLLKEVPAKEAAPETESLI